MAEGHAGRMHSRSRSSVDGLVETMQGTLGIVVGALTAIAGDGCVQFRSPGPDLSCLDERPDEPTGWCPSCAALAALTATQTEGP